MKTVVLRAYFVYIYFEIEVLLCVLCILYNAVSHALGFSSLGVGVYPSVIALHGDQLSQVSWERLGRFWTPVVRSLLHCHRGLSSVARGIVVSIQVRIDVLYDSKLLKR